MGIKQLSKKLVTLGVLSVLVLTTPVFADDFLEDVNEPEAAVIMEDDVTESNVNAEDFGGWDETKGDFSFGKIMARASANHVGISESKSIKGTSHKRAHGWTGWKGVYHYTRARMYRNGAIKTDSGRKWKTSNSEAASPWLKFNGESTGSAKTYWGK